MKIIALLLLFCSVCSLSAQTNPTALAPILVGPYDGADVVENQVVWTWFMQSKASAGKEILCGLVVVEIIEGQTPEEAMRLNPPVVRKENLTSSAWQSNFTMRDFRDGHRYAWHIVAKILKDGTTNGSMQVISSSEIWTFTYAAPRDKIEQPTIAVQSSDSSYNHTEELPESAKPKFFELEGRSRLSLETANRPARISQTPQSQARWQIDPTVKLFGVPFGMSFLITTEENTQNSDINRGAFGSQSTRKGLNLVLQQQLEDNIARYEQSRDSASIDSLRELSGLDSVAISERIAALHKLQDMDLSENLEALNQFVPVTAEQELLAKFPAFGFGKVAPQFGSLLFNNVTINGGMLEYNPSYLYCAGAVGKVQRIVDISAVPQQTFENDTAFFRNSALSELQFFRNVYSARLGFGRRNGNHIMITGMYADDDEQSRSLQNVLNKPTRRDSTIITDPNDPTLNRDTSILVPNIIVSSQRNYGFGGLGHLTIPETNLVLDGEFNLMYLEDKANYGSQKKIPLPQSLPEWLRKDSTLTDFNFAAKLNYLFDENNGRVSAGIRYVGGGYRSVGTAAIRNDVLRTDVFLNRIFFDRTLRVHAQISHEEAGYKDTVNTSKILTFGGGVEMRLPSLPIVNIGYSQHLQGLETNKRDSLNRNATRNTIKQFTVSGSYLYGGNSNFSTFISYNRQDGTSELAASGVQPDSVGIFASDGILMTQRVALSRSISAGITGNFTSTATFPSIKDTITKIITIGGVDSTIITIEKKSVKEIVSIVGIDFSLLFTPNEWLQATIGANINYDTGKKSNVLGMYFTSRTLVAQNADLELRLTYRELPIVANGTSDADFVARVVANFRW
jgi:hypothetical protein